MRTLSSITYKRGGNFRSKQRTEKQQIIDGLRKKWMSDPQKHKAIQKQAVRIEMPDGRRRTLIRCAACGGLFPRQEIEANHIVPVGSLASVGEADVAAYTKRMFCKASGLEALCKPCHRKTTALQRRGWQPAQRLQPAIQA